MHVYACLWLPGGGVPSPGKACVLARCFPAARAVAAAWIGVVHTASAWVPQEHRGRAMSFLTLSYVAGDFASRDALGAVRAGPAPACGLDYAFPRGAYACVRPSSHTCR